MKNKRPLFTVCVDEGLPGVLGYYDHCVKCNASIFVSNSTVHAAKKVGYKKDEINPHCFKCGLPKAYDKSNEIMPFTKEQEEEIKCYFNPGMQ